MANPQTARRASAFAASEQTMVWIPLPEALGMCAVNDAPTPQAPVSRLWAQMRGTWLKARSRTD
ncbi:hypothetical protein [Azospirillum picis]|uniref:Uncharacterized protein n=1 Tax=Azospirillum picis TaxID=488438 RepID=A0ABU0MV91_9PROT|nr:hypothetical protein [Azospirillum picis]MBP2303525.1 hypothetical protein [Azospirillum picis]MDQ0537397.1 hypothetical protein [Azospirillum picis]